VNLFYQPLLPQGNFYLDAEESRHCVKVLRRKNGDAIRITDGQGLFYDAIITEANASKCYFSLRTTIPEEKKNYIIHVAIAPTKNPDRLEWFVEKATEIGIDKITFLRTEHTEKIFLKKERLSKVAVSAMKQSLKATLPAISDSRSFDDFLAESAEAKKFIAYVDETNPLHLKDAARKESSSLVLIGPEGDFSKRELDLALARGFQKVSLGRSRLRTETAGMVACHILNLVNS
jgi:16S rRNA (uracil1498-N3)-methyltransferase